MMPQRQFTRINVDAAIYYFSSKYLTLTTRFVSLQCGSIAGAISVVLVLTFISLRFPYMYYASWEIYVGAFVLPFVGFLFGYIVAAICRQDAVRCRTIALETGIQNFPLCMTILILTFTKEVFAQISLFPLLYGITCIICSLMFLILYKLIQNVKINRQKEREQFTSITMVDS